MERTADHGRQPETAAMYDSDMQAYIGNRNTAKKRAGPEEHRIDERMGPARGGCRESLMTDDRPRSLAIWCLKLAVARPIAGETPGHWPALQEQMATETALFSLLWEPAEVGGLALGETAAVVICRVLAVLLIGCGTLQLLWSGGRLLVTIAVAQLALAVSMWLMNSGYPAELVTWSPLLARYLPLATQAIRIAAPLVLWLIAGGGHPRIAESLARWSIALTFAGHGVEALVHYHQFIEMLLRAGPTLRGDARSSRRRESADCHRLGRHRGGHTDRGHPVASGRRVHGILGTPNRRQSHRRQRLVPGLGRHSNAARPLRAAAAAGPLVESRPPGDSIA